MVKGLGFEVCGVSIGETGGKTNPKLHGHCSYVGVVLGWKP